MHFPLFIRFWTSCSAAGFGNSVRTHCSSYSLSALGGIGSGRGFFQCALLSTAAVERIPIPRCRTGLSGFFLTGLSGFCLTGSGFFLTGLSGFCLTGSGFFLTGLSGFFLTGLSGFFLTGLSGCFPEVLSGSLQ